MNVDTAHSLSDFGVKKHRLVLENGLETIFIEKPFAPIHAKLTLGAGSVFNPSDNGLAHFTEHMLAGASKNYPRKEMMASIINPIGGFTNAYTNLTMMSVVCEVALRGHLPQMRKFFSETLGDIHVTPQLLEKEKGVITSEIMQSISKPSYQSNRHVKRIFGGNTPWSYSNLGEVDAMQALTIADVESFYEERCNNVNNMVLVACGGCTLSEIKETFGSIQLRSGGPKSTKPADPTPLLPNQRIFYEQSIEQNEIAIGFLGPEFTTRESMVLKFALSFAHAGLDSRFYSKMRNEKGLVYSVWNESVAFNKLQYTGTHFNVPAEKSDQAIEAALECYREFLSEGMTAKEIEGRIQRRYFADKRGTERSVDWVRLFEDFYETEDHPVGDYPDIFNFQESITPEEISDVLQKYITLDDFKLFVVGKKPSELYF